MTGEGARLGGGGGGSVGLGGGSIGGAGWRVCRRSGKTSIQIYILCRNLRVVLIWQPHGQLLSESRHICNKIARRGRALGLRCCADSLSRQVGVVADHLENVP